jgi:hypothetical protein
LRLKRKLLAAVLLPVKLLAAPVMAKIGEILNRRRRQTEFVDYTENKKIEVEK